MARLLGIRAGDITPFARWLFSAPGSLAQLASAQPEGWGAAVFDGCTEAWWMERRAFGTAPAQSFASISPRLRGTVLIAHLRARTDIGSSSETTQPVKRDGWLLACDGTLEEIEFVRRSVSPSRLRERADGSHAELLFAYLLTRLDAVPGNIDNALRAAVADLAANGAGTMTFVLSNGRSLYGYKGRPSLHVVEEVGGAPVAVIASEPLSDGPWRVLDDGSLVRAGPDLVFLVGEDPRSRWDERDIELPFTD